MFAIETIVEDSLYAIRYEDEHDEFENNEFEEDTSPKDELRRIFSNWSDVEYLYAFFSKHEEDLKKDFYGFTSIEDAVNRTLAEADELEKELLDVAKKGKEDVSQSLQTLFKPLNKKDEKLFPIPDYQESKVYGNEYKSWLRIYAIRIDINVFIITGGAIKLTQTMNERPHLQKELDNLKRVKQFLKNEGIIDNDSIVDFIELY